MWDECHCQEYEGLTIEEKLLVDEKMKEQWFKTFDYRYLVPTVVFKLTERRIIEELKRKEK